MFDFHDFDDAFGFDTECSYDGDAIQNIAINKRAMEGLFVEKMMRMVGIKRPTKLYPPKTNEDLRDLHQAISEGGGAEHLKISLIYYILLDIDYSTGSREHSTTFEQKVFMPQKYVIFMRGLFHLDRQEFDDAIQYLTYPSLTPTFTDEILELLVRMNTNNLTLALAYYHAVQPVLKEQKSIECLFSAIARTNITEAFYFCRSRPEYSKRHTFEMLISLALQAPSLNLPTKAIADRTVELANLPFNAQEEAWFEEYLLTGEGRSLKRSRDTVMFRRIATGKFEESLALKGMTSRGIGGLDWNSLSHSVQNGLGPRLGI